MRIPMLVVCLLVSAVAAAETIAFVNVQVVPMTENRVLHDQVVIVDGDRIQAIGPKDTVAIPVGATRIDGGGGFLIPGLIDLHVHLHYGSDVQLYPLNGVTTVLVPGGSLGELELRDRPAAAAGPVPRIVTCGPSLSGIATAAEAEQRLDEQQADGYDCIKIYADISKDALRALVDGARKRGLLSIGHIPRNLLWQDMLALEPDAIAHLEEFIYSPMESGDREIVTGLMRKQGIANITTLHNYSVITRQVGNLDEMFDGAELQYISPILMRMWEAPWNDRHRRIKSSDLPKMRWLLSFQKDLARRFHAARVPVLMGTDAGGPPFVLPGWSATDELRMLVSAGLEPYDALRAATAGAAKFLRRDDRGVIAPGKVADLVLLRGDPLDDIDNVALRAGVMLRGRWLDQAEIRRALTAIRAANDDERELLRIHRAEGIDAALAFARAKTAIPEASLNELGYQLLRVDKDVPAAVKVFRLNAELHPRSWAAIDSLGEGLLEAGDRDGARKAYEQSLALEPRNRGAKAAIEAIR